MKQGFNINVRARDLIRIAYPLSESLGVKYIATLDIEDFLPAKE